MYDTHDEDYDKFENVERLNKSQQKREIQALLALGKQLAGLDAIALGKMDIPRELFHALLDVPSMKFGAEKRQFKLICKMLRQINTESLQQTLDELGGRKEELDKNFHRTEYWRERLITEGQIAMTEFMAAFPQADSSQIRQLVRNANKELLENKAPKSSRSLFRLLRSVISQ
ncbi:MAG: ribosome biogenesis factor YjgA [Mariprofundus sp.]|nr:ribosome biogenesis factor YjgA [Mariprofundus sp.]